MEVRSVDQYAFFDCTKLKNINVDSKNDWLESIDGVLVEEESGKKTLLAYPKGRKNKTYTIPDSVEVIGFSAFEGCDTLTKVILSDSVKSI